MPGNNSEIIFLFLLGSLFLIAFVAAKTGPSHDKIVVCYYSSWASKRPGKGAYTIEQLDMNLCTHLIYSFADLDLENDTIKPLDEWRDLRDNGGQGGFERVTALKKTNPHLKVSLLISDTMQGYRGCLNLAGNAVRRKKFAKQTSEFILKHSFDGMDFYWEYLTYRDNSPNDRANFILLAKELHEEFKKHNLLFTIAVAASKTKIDRAYNVRELAKYADYFHVMSFDYSENWDKQVGPNAPLDNRKENSVKFTIEYLMRMGCPASKLVMGIPFYGKTFVTAKAGNFGDERYDVLFEGQYSQVKGFIGYNEICELLSNKSLVWTETWDSKTSQSIARLHEGNLTKVVIYDSARSVANKVRLVIQNNLAGVLVFSIETDDFLGECELDKDTFTIFDKECFIKLKIPRRIYGNYPLLRTVNEAIILANDELEMLKSVCWSPFE